LFDVLSKKKFRIEIKGSGEKVKIDGANTEKRKKDFASLQQRQCFNLNISWPKRAQKHDTIGDSLCDSALRPTPKALADGVSGNIFKLRQYSTAHSSKS